MEKTIDKHKRYSFPKDIRVIRHNNKIIVITPETSNWIVLESEHQLDMFNFLCNNSLAESLEKFKGCEEDISFVVTQIEARHLESTNTRSNSYDVMQLYLTNECNMRCPHCYMYAGTALRNELTTEEIETLLKNFALSGGKKIVMTGGEIGLRKDLTHIVKWAYDLNLTVELLTNGTLFDAETIDILSQHIRRVQVSIDGFSEESNAKIRGKGNFTKALATVERFVLNKIPTEIAITPYPSNTLKDEMQGYIDFGKKLKQKFGDKLLIKYTTGLIDGRTINRDNVDHKEYERIMKDIISAVYGTNDSFSGFVLSARNQVLNDNCAYGALNVSANGDIFPCAKIYQTQKFGNIRMTDWNTIINKSKRLKQMSNINNIEPCNQCELKNICGGGCRLDYIPVFATTEKLLASKNKPYRICNKKEKDELLDLLIKANTYIFR